MSDQPEPLNPAADHFLKSTPGLKYPVALAVQFPRIANRIVELRDRPSELRAYFSDLASDARGGRHGFPFDVLMDIDTLREFMLPDDGPSEIDDTIKWVS